METDLNGKRQSPKDNVVFTFYLNWMFLLNKINMLFFFKEMNAHPQSIICYFVYI